MTKRIFSPITAVLMVCFLIISISMYTPLGSIRVYAANSINSEIDNCYPKNVSYTTSYRIYTYDVYGNKEGNRWIDAGDSYTIFEAYTSGFCKIEYPALEGQRIAYALISDCNGYKPLNPTGYNISVSSTEIYDCEKVRIEITAYDNLATGYKIYVVKPDGTLMGCKDLKENNSVIVMPNAPGVWRVYAEVYNQYGSFVGAVDNGCMEIRVLNSPNLGSKVDLGTNFYAYIINTHSGNVLTNDNDNVSCRTKQSSKNQQWKFKKKSDGSYEIESASASGKHLDEYSGSGKQGDNVQVYAASSDQTVQSWFIYSAGNGSYYFRPSCSNSAVLDVYDASTESGANVQIWAYNQTEAQKFKVEKIGNATLKFSTKTVNLNLNGTNSVTVNITADGLLPSSYHFNCNRDTSAMTTSWGGWSGSTSPLTIKGIKTGTYSVKVSLVNGDTSEVLYTDTITVNISCTHNYVTKVISATATTQGYTLHTCSICSYSYKDNYTDPLGIDISSCNIVLGTTSYTYDGTAKQPTVTVKNGTTSLINGTHYNVSYSNNTNVGNATVTITGKGNYKGSVSKTYTINAKSISGAAITLATSSYTYDGYAKKPSVTVKVDSKNLINGTDYTISYSNNINAGTATVTVTGKGNYTGTVKTNFTIIDVPKIADCIITLNSSSYVYDGTAKQPTVTIKYGSTTLTNGTHYSVSYSNNTNVGTATITITGKGDYTGTVTKTFSITAKSISGATVTLGTTSYVYNGAEKKPSVTVKDGSKILASGTDYTVSYSYNINVGTATATVIGKGNYKDTASKTFTISKKSISDAAVTLNPTSYTYDGTAKEPAATVKVDSKTLTSGTDYTVDYVNNVNVGTATAKITGKGNYTGTASANFTITEKPKIDINSCTITLSTTSYVYDGTAKQPTVTVKNGSTTLTNGTHYSVSYSNNIIAGTANVTITGKGDYTGSVIKTFSITAKSISGATITLGTSTYIYDGYAKKPSVTVKVDSKTLTSGTDYDVSYSNNINAGTATVTVTGRGNYNNMVSKTFTINAKSIEGATITLSQTSYTYDGTAKKPTVTVNDGTKTLKNGTDYTVNYSNNIIVGTATVTVTGTGNYTRTITKTFTIEKEKKTFEWGKDNWNFNNWTSYFFSNGVRGNSKSLINDNYLSKLKQNLSNSEYQTVFTGYYGYDEQWHSAWLEKEWGGSCYGMSSTTLLSKEGLLSFSAYKSGANKLHDIDAPNKNSLNYPSSSANVSSLITYYQMLQVKKIIQQQYRTVPYNTNESNIRKIISLLDKNSTVLVGFKKEGWGAHAILAYGYEYGSFTKNGVTYQGRIKICDPNYSVSNNENYYIYFNTNSYNWAIPAYSSDKISSAYGAVFNYVGADINEINEGGYLLSSSGNKIDSFVARIDAISLSNDRSIFKVSDSNGTYINMNNAPGDIIEDYSYILGGKSEGTIGYNLFDAESAYKVTQDDPVEMSLSIDYENCLLSAGSAAGKSVIFDKAGFISINGESADYNMAMTFDTNYPTEWFTVQVKGSGANDASLRKEKNGWIISSDNLKNVEVRTNNKEVSAFTKFSTNYLSALIYEIDKNTIGIKVDTDNNGTYETILNTAVLPKITATSGASTVTLKWTAVPGAERYGIAGYVNGKWQNIAECSTTSYTLNDLKTGTNYKVAVIAKVNGTWNKDYSNAITVTPNKPYPIVKSEVQGRQFRLKWTAVSGAEKYGIAVYQSGGWRVKVQLNGNTTTYTSPKMKSGTYKMVVCAKINGSWYTSNIKSRAFIVTLV